MLQARIERMPSRQRWWAGLCLLLLSAWMSMYGKIWAFESMEAHRFTARAIMTGTLRLRGVVALAKGDEQIYDGAVYTNWGFGVPLLQIPFHALAAVFGYLHGFFPDRAIYFFYLACSIPVIWKGFEDLLAMRQPAGDPIARQKVAWAATWLVLTLTVFPLMSTRFVIFEETIAYMMIFELMALAAYIRTLRSASSASVVATAAAAGVALLVRPTGLLYLGIWGALVALQKNARRTLQFAATAAPFLGFWMWTNWVRGGSLFGLGQMNSNPSWEYETPLLRFGSACTDTPLHTLQAAARLFNGFFFIVSRVATPWMRTCHFDFEERDFMRDPFFGPGVLVLVGGMVWGLVRRRERRLSLYVPFAGLALLFAAFVRRGDGFAWRYAGDFWPLITLATVLYVQTLDASRRAPDARMAKILFWIGFAAFARYLVPWEWTFRANVLGGRDLTSMWDSFAASRWGHDDPLPSKRSCSDPQSPPFHNGLGWRQGCTVATFTNFYLGLPSKTSTAYTLRLETEGMTAPTVRVYANGRFYDARRAGDDYEVTLDLDPAAFHSPLVMFTVQWAPGLVPPPGRFLSAQLT